MLPLPGTGALRHSGHTDGAGVESEADGEAACGRELQRAGTGDRLDLRPDPGRRAPEGSESARQGDALASGGSASQVRGHAGVVSTAVGRARTPSQAGAPPLTHPFSTPSSSELQT